MMKKQFRLYVLALIGLLSACQNDDSDFDELKSQAKESPVEITFSSSPLTETPDQLPEADAPTYINYAETFKPQEVVNIEFSEKGVIVTGEKKVFVYQDGAHVIADINKTAAKFVLSGKNSNGSLKIYGESRFQISFNGLNLTNPDGAAINNQCKKMLYIENVAGTENKLVSSKLSSTEISTDEDEKGCIFSEGQLAFSGSGRLIVTTSFRSGIVSDDYIFIRPQTQFYITSNSGHGIKAKDGVTINGGTIDISLNSAGAKGINCESNITINGGRTTIENLGTTRLDKVDVSEEFPEGIDTVSCAGVKSDKSVLINGGQLLVKCSGDDSKGIKAKMDYLQSGGTVKVVTLGRKVLAAPKGIKTDGNLIMTSGGLYSYSAFSKPIDADGEIRVPVYRKQKTYVVEF